VGYVSLHPPYIILLWMIVMMIVVVFVLVRLTQSLWLYLSAARLTIVSAATAPCSNLNPVVADKKPDLTPQRHWCL
jgi:hypothetical protein